MDEVILPRPKQPNTLLVNVLIPQKDGKYTRNDVVLQEGKISAIAPGKSLDPVEFPNVDEIVDCTENMLLPGFVNAHTHSSQHWTKGLIKPLPLEMWLFQLYRHAPIGVEGWFGKDSFVKTPSSAIGISALHAGLESLLSGCTAILDHLFVRNIDDIGEAVKAYKALGIRAFIAPMLNDESELFANYFPLVHDANERNEVLKANKNKWTSGYCCGGGVGPDNLHRVKFGTFDPVKTKSVLALWEEAVQKYHDPSNGIEIVIAPVGAFSCSVDLFKGATELRKKYNLCGHTHLLETRAQALEAKQFFPSQSAVKHLRDVGFLSKELRGTSLAHTIWLSKEEMDIVGENNGTCVHNPVSNLRLGSGVMPVLRASNLSNVKVAMGVDGATSSDGQDMLETLKLGTMLTAVTNSDYKEWATPKHFALNLASKNGYAALGMEDEAGQIQIGQKADLTLWDLTSLALLPKTDPLSILILGSRTQAKSAGSTLQTAWVNGQKVVSDGEPTGINIEALRNVLIQSQPDYRDPEITDPSTDERTAAVEREYRAAMGLDTENQVLPTPTSLGTFPQDRVLYDSKIP